MLKFTYEQLGSLGANLSNIEHYAGNARHESGGFYPDTDRETTIEDVADLLDSLEVYLGLAREELARLTAIEAEVLSA